ALHLHRVRARRLGRHAHRRQRGGPADDLPAVLQRPSLDGQGAVAMAQPVEHVGHHGARQRRERRRIVHGRTATFLSSPRLTAYRALRVKTYSVSLSVAPPTGASDRATAPIRAPAVL